MSSNPRQELLRELDRVYEDVATSELPAAVEQLETSLSLSLSQILGEYCVRNIKGATQTMQAQYFLLDGILFETRIENRDILDSTTICVAILRVKPSNRYSTVAKEHLELQGCGSFTSVEVVLDELLASHTTNICGLAKELYETGYAWLLEFLRKRLAELESNLSVELYRIVRTIFSGNQASIARSLWFCVIEKNEEKSASGFFILDRLHGEETLDLLVRSRDQTGQSPATLFSLYLSSVFDFDEMHSRFAIQSAQPIDKRLADSIYLPRIPKLTIAEEAMYGESVTLYPIVREGNGFLIAVFPSPLKVQVIKTLETALADFSTAFANQRSASKRALKYLQKHSKGLMSEAAGEFSGGFVKAFLS